MWTECWGETREIGLGEGVGAGVGYAGSMLDRDVVENSDGKATAVELIVGEDGGVAEQKGRNGERQAYVLSRSRVR